MQDQKDQLDENGYPIYFEWICQHCGDIRAGIKQPSYGAKCSNEQDWECNGEY